MKEFIKSAREIYDMNGELVLGTILGTIEEHLEVSDQEWFNKCKTEWEEYQNDILETIEDFESKAKENEILRSKLEQVLAQTREAKKQVEIKLEDKITAQRAQFINKAMIGIISSVSTIMLIVLVGWFCGLKDAAVLVDKFGTVILSGFVGSIIAFVSIKQVQKDQQNDNNGRTENLGSDCP